MEGLQTEETASRSFCAGWCFVDPLGLRMFFVSCVCKAANLGFACKIESSIGGSIFVLSSVFRDVNIEVDATYQLQKRPACFPWSTSTSNFQKHAETLTQRISLLELYTSNCHEIRQHGYR